MSGPRVLHLIGNLKREGAQVVLANLVVRGKARGGDPLVAPWRGGGPVSDTIAAAGVPILSLPTLPGGPVALPLVVAALAARVRRHAVDIVHAHMSDSAIIAAGASRIARVPFVITHHSNRLLPREGSMATKLRAALFGPAVRAARANVAVSDEVRERLLAAIGIAADRVCVVRNGIPIPDDAALAAAQARRGAWRSGGQGPVIAVVGRLVEIKGQRQLIAASPAILARHPRTHVVIVGDGPDRDALAAQAQALGVAQHVEFTGSIADVAGVLAAADLYVSTSLYEGLPTALLEAMSWAVPAVASDVPGNRDLVRDGETGRVYVHGDVDGLAQAVVSMLSDPVAPALAERGRALAAAQYGIDAMVAGYDAIYRRACDGQRHRAA